MSIQKFKIAGGLGRKAFAIYAEPANLNYFLKTAITPVTAGDAVIKDVDSKAASVRQYPGDPTPFNRPATVRAVVFDPSRKTGNGLPGRSIILVADAGLPAEEKRQFTLYGNWTDFHHWLKGVAKMEIYAYNNKGTRYVVPAATSAP